MLVPLLEFQLCKPISSLYSPLANKEQLPVIIPTQPSLGSCRNKRESREPASNHNHFDWSNINLHLFCLPKIELSDKHVNL